jgi:hypothetical protein
MYEDLADYPSITGSSAQTENLEFTVPETGVYYFGFHAYSALNQFYLYIDDIVIDSELSTTNPENTSLTVYPNPVNDYVTIAFDRLITKVTVHNILGQDVMIREVNENETRLDMSALAAGTYMIKVYADDSVKTVKVIKK